MKSNIITSIIDINAPDYQLLVQYNGHEKIRLNLLPLIESAESQSKPFWGELKDQDLFAEVRLTKIGGTVEWPNGADICPELLYAQYAEKVA